LTIPCIALLGRQDESTDAVEEYCHYLAAALQTHDIRLEIHRVAWEKDGWPHALQAPRLQATKWRGTSLVCKRLESALVCPQLST
jgi:hypothetical protein